MPSQQVYCYVGQASMHIPVIGTASDCIHQGGRQSTALSAQPVIHNVMLCTETVLNHLRHDGLQNCQTQWS